MNIHHEHRYPWTTEQKVSVVMSGVIVVGFSLMMYFLSSGKVFWLALLVLAPAASWWAYRTNVTRKNASALKVTIVDGHLECASEYNDPSGSPVMLDGIEHVAAVKVKNRDVITFSGQSGDKAQRQRIPARAFTPGNPVGPIVIEAARKNNVTLSDQVVALLLG